MYLSSRLLKILWEYKYQRTSNLSLFKFPFQPAKKRGKKKSKSKDTILTTPHIFEQIENMGASRRALDRGEHVEREVGENGLGHLDACLLRTDRS